jgi:hypothetical protein
VLYRNRGRLGLEISSGEHRLFGYVSLRNEAAGGTQNVQLRMRESRDAPGQMARYA